MHTPQGAPERSSSVVRAFLDQHRGRETPSPDVVQVMKAMERVLSQSSVAGPSDIQPAQAYYVAGNLNLYRALRRRVPAFSSDASPAVSSGMPPVLLDAIGSASPLS
ncbi:MAG: hypothetical protein AAB588_06465 [Patescibacteria group bacterium]